MSYNWGHLLDLAENIYNKAASLGEVNACYRTVINRSYYAAHKLSFQYLWDYHPGFRPQFTKSGEDHGRVISLMSTLLDKTACLIISNKLSELLDYRKKADYDSSVNRLKDKAVSSLEWSRMVREYLNMLTST